MRILITGGDGFVGTYLRRELEDHEVISSDRHDADLSQPYEAAQLLDRANPDYVVHLAARYGRLLCRDEPHKAVSDNAAATTELAAWCARKRVPVLYASSSEVYGDHGENAITEDSDLLTPTTIYGLSKRWGEEALRLYLPPQQLCIARLNMLFGPDQRGGYGCCALATFIRDALEGERALTVHAGASRSWLYITDAVKALRLLIEDHHRGIFNVGNPARPLPMTQVADMVFEATEARPCLELIDAPATQIKHKNYTANKLTELGWKPEVGLEEGIRRTVKAARTNGIRDYAGVGVK